MAQIRWTHKGNGNWTTASDWSSGTESARDQIVIGDQHEMPDRRDDVG
jgi:hypothetical protein